MKEWESEGKLIFYNSKNKKIIKSLTLQTKGQTDTNTNRLALLYNDKILLNVCLIVS